MATNTIIITFTPCSPAPAEGYILFYKEVGAPDLIQWPTPFTTSPIEIEVEGPENQPYEGYLISDCGGGVFGEHVPFVTEVIL